MGFVGAINGRTTVDGVNVIFDDNFPPFQGEAVTGDFSGNPVITCSRIVCLSVCLSTCLYIVRPFISLSICPSVCPYVCSPSPNSPVSLSLIKFWIVCILSAFKQAASWLQPLHLLFYVRDSQPLYTHGCKCHFFQGRRVPMSTIYENRTKNNEKVNFLLITL